MRILSVLLLLTAVAGAHPVDMAYLHIDAHGDTFAIDLEGVVDANVGEPSGCTLTKVQREGSRLRAVAECTAGRHIWLLPMRQVMVKQGERLDLVEDGRVTLETTGGVLLADFVRAGMAHIGVAPSEWRSADGGLKFPDGIDHILFVIALMLGGGRLLRLMGIATGFTVGHSITLALAALDVVRPPASVIEPLVALTIAAAALEAYSGKLERHRFKIAIAFGLVHGFAFASALRELSSGKLVALAGFNLGVELGQLVIIFVCAPIVLVALPKRAVRPIAVSILALSVLWFLERL